MDNATDGGRGFLRSIIQHWSVLAERQLLDIYQTLRSIKRYIGVTMFLPRGTAVTGAIVARILVTTGLSSPLPRGMRMSTRRLATVRHSIVSLALRFLRGANRTTMPRRAPMQRPGATSVPASVSWWAAKGLHGCSFWSACGDGGHLTWLSTVGRQRSL